MEGLLEAVPHELAAPDDQTDLIFAIKPLNPLFVINTLHLSSEVVFFKIYVIWFFLFGEVAPQQLDGQFVFRMVEFF